MIPTSTGTKICLSKSSCRKFLSYVCYSFQSEENLGVFWEILINKRFRKNINILVIDCFVPYNSKVLLALGKSHSLFTNIVNFPRES